MKENNALIILGMHRSGTSLLAGLLSQVGVKMGRSLYAPQKGVNEKGFWEHEDIVDTHDELLLHLNSQWDDLLPWDETLGEKWWETDIGQIVLQPVDRSGRTRFQGCTCLGTQRSAHVPFITGMVSRFLNPANQGHLHLHESEPVRSHGSLQKRDHFSREKALVLWLIHSLAAERYSRGLPRVFIDFDQVVANPVRGIIKDRAGSQSRFSGPGRMQQRKKSRSSYPPRLRHHKADELEPPHEGCH